MKLNQLLNSDMQTIGSVLRGGFDWWRAELAGMMPRRATVTARRPAALAVVSTNGELSLVKEGEIQASSVPVANTQGIPALIPASEFLVRRLPVPAMNQRDLSAMLALDGDRYFPMPAGSSLFAATVSTNSGDGTMEVDVAAWPADRAQRAANALLGAGVSPSTVRPADPDFVPDPRFDFLPALRDRGMLPGSGQGAKAWWAIVVVLFAMNLGMIAWRDSAQLDRMQALVDAQAPAALAAQRIVQQARGAQALIRRSVHEREVNDAVAILAEVTRAMPDGAWVQRYTFEGNTLRLTGYRLANVDVAAALRRSPRFTSVKSAQSDQTAPGVDGQAFDLSAQLRSE